MSLDPEVRVGLSADASGSSSASSGLNSSNSPVGSDSGYTSGARTPQPGRAVAEDSAVLAPTDWSPAGPSVASSPRAAHQRKRSSVSIPLKLTTRTGPRRLRGEPPDNTLDTTTRQELIWDDADSTDSMPSPMTDYRHALDKPLPPCGYAPSEADTVSSSLSSFGTAEYSRPPSMIHGRPAPKRRGTLGYVISSSSRSSVSIGQLPDSAASSISSHHSSPRTPSVYGAPPRDRQRTTSGWTSSSSGPVPIELSSPRPSHSLSLTPVSVAGSPIPHTPVHASSLAAAASDRPVEDGTTLLTLYKDLLSAIASKQRTCAELRQELEREEADLRELQRLWEAQVQRELAAQGGNAVLATSADSASAKTIVPSPGSSLLTTAAASSSTKRSQLGSLAAASRSNESLNATSATDTFRKLLGGWGISTPTIPTPLASKQSGGNSNSNSYFPLATSAGHPKGAFSSASSSTASSPQVGTPLNGLSDEEEAQLLNHFQPRDLDKEREQSGSNPGLAADHGLHEQKVSGLSQNSPKLGSSVEVPAASPSIVVGQQVERSGTKTPTPDTISEISPSRENELAPAVGKGRKGSIASEGSDIHTPKIKSSARMFSDDATPTNGRDVGKAREKQAKSVADTGRNPTAAGRKAGQGLAGGSVLFPRRTGDSATPSPSTSSPTLASTASSSSSTIREGWTGPNKAAGSGQTPRSPAASSLPAWGAKRFSMLGESISAFSAKVEEQFALAAAAAASTASASSPPPYPDTVNPASRKGALPELPRDADSQRAAVHSAGQEDGARSSVISDSKGDESAAPGLSSTFGAWSTKRLKEAGDFLASAERTIGNALILDDRASSPNGHPRRQSGSMPMSSGERKASMDMGGPGSSDWHRAKVSAQNGSGGGGGRSNPLNEGPSGSRRQSLMMGAAVGGSNSNSPSSSPVVPERSRFEFEAEREREALRQFGRRERPRSPPSAPSSQHTRTSSILSSMGGGGATETGSSSSHSNSHRRSLSLGLSRPGSIFSSAEAGVSSLFGMLSNALTVPPDEGEEEHAEDGTGDDNHKKNVMDY